MQFHSPLYSAGRIGLSHRNEPDSQILFSDGRYPTKIHPQDLPPWYMEAVLYSYRRCYLSAKGVKGLYYQPNLVFNHLFKDDFLYISYSAPITAAAALGQQNYDYVVWGNAIPKFLLWTEKYSGYDIADLSDQVNAKALWLRETYPQEAEKLHITQVSIMDYYRALYAEQLK